MRGLLKVARRPLTDEWKPYRLDPERWRVLDNLADRLVHHRHFEHLARKGLAALSMTPFDGTRTLRPDGRFSTDKGTYENLA